MVNQPSSLPRIQSARFFPFLQICKDGNWTGTNHPIGLEKRYYHTVTSVYCKCIVKLTVNYLEQIFSGFGMKYSVKQLQITSIY